MLGLLTTNNRIEASLISGASISLSFLRASYQYLPPLIRHISLGIFATEPSEKVQLTIGPNSVALREFASVEAENATRVVSRIASSDFINSPLT